MVSIKQLQSRLEVATSAREKVEIGQAIAFLQKQAKAKSEAKAESMTLADCAKRAGMSVAEYMSFHGY